MNRDKKILYFVTIIIFATLLATLFVDIGSSKIVTACLLLPLALLTWFVIRKRATLSIKKREVMLLSASIGIIYVILLQMTGIFFEFYKNPYAVSLEGFFETVLPSIVIIISVEIIRYVILAQKNTFTSILAYLIGILAEVLMLTNFVGIISFNRFMDLVGMTLFPAISANIYYHYISKRYGFLPNIVFRLITTLYIYFLPSTADIADALNACIKIVLPIILLAFFSALYEKKKRNALQKGSKLSTVAMILTVIFTVSVAMLISCQFRFGALVIATESMTGEINKGDMILYERYEDQNIKEGQVIIFNKNGNYIVHRVIQVENIGNETRYYTKGDANTDMDSGFRLESDIVGLTDVKISYIGYPTLWLRELISND